MALPKPIKEKVSMMALQEAADAEFPDEEELEQKPMRMKPQEEMKPMNVVYVCPGCGHEGMEEEFAQEE